MCYTEVDLDLNSLQRVIAQRTFPYEEGHESHPWNEFADVTAKAACRDQFERYFHRAPANWWANGNSRFASWDFLQRPTPRQKIEYPSIISGQRCRLSIHGQVVPDAFIPAATIAAAYDDFREADTDTTVPPLDRQTQLSSPQREHNS